MDGHFAPAEQYRPRGLLAAAAGVAAHLDLIRHAATSNLIQPPHTANVAVSAADELRSGDERR